jgi:hypothetical protein
VRKKANTIYRISGSKKSGSRKQDGRSRQDDGGGDPLINGGGDERRAETPFIRPPDPSSSEVGGYVGTTRSCKPTSDEHAMDPNLNPDCSSLSGASQFQNIGSAQSDLRQGTRQVTTPNPNPDNSSVPPAGQVNVSPNLDTATDSLQAQIHHNSAFTCSPDQMKGHNSVDSGLGNGWLGREDGECSPERDVFSTTDEAIANSPMPGTCTENGSNGRTTLPLEAQLSSSTSSPPSKTTGTSSAVSAITPPRQTTSTSPQNPVAGTTPSAVAVQSPHAQGGNTDDPSYPTNVVGSLNDACDKESLAEDGNCCDNVEDTQSRVCDSKVC